MVYAALSRLARLRVTVGYGAILVCVNTTLLALRPALQDQVIRHASTNLHNLSRGHLGTLFSSAFVVDASPVALWLPGLLCLLGLAELLWRSTRLVVAFVVGHVGATLLVAIGLTAGVSWGWLPGTVTRATDVGMSYGAIAVLGALTPAIPRRWRPIWVGWWLAVGAAVTAVDRDFTDVGHVVALALGMAVALRFGTPGPWTPPRVALLVVGSIFGFFVVAESFGALAAPCGLAGALFAALLTRLWTATRARPGVGPVGTELPAIHA
ncbi:MULTISPECIES: rhomboid-like protein [unclassified Mycobacterium]|uniref:rhomboid-like protein n=1 Tax=unclassified Mycobacterium TaxID=2642494 RepID=UPI0029C7104D|nr:MULTISPECIES: rhomboid-like protein [unclassified Mycobacterium]